MNTPVEPDTSLALLREAATYAESRINLVDGKAALMLTAVAALFASLVFVVGDLPRVERVLTAESVLYLLLAVALVLGTIAVAYLLQTVRHGRWFFGTDVPIQKHDVEPYFMWPSETFPSDFGTFRTAAAALSQTDYFNNLAATAYATLQLVRLKYRNYRRAMLFIKVLGAWTAVSIVTIASLRLAGHL
jgi:hypothetical protein